MCQTPEQAARIVAAVTGKAQEVIQLKEPAVTEANVIARDIAASLIDQNFNSFEPDQGCCSPAIMSASRKGVLKSLTSWECPRCGCEWTPTQHGALRHWSPVAAVAIIKSAR